MTLKWWTTSNNLLTFMKLINSLFQTEIKVAAQAVVQKLWNGTPLKGYSVWMSCRRATGRQYHCQKTNSRISGTCTKLWLTQKLITNFTYLCLIPATFEMPLINLTSKKTMKIWIIFVFYLSYIFEFEWSWIVKAVKVFRLHFWFSS